MTIEERERDLDQKLKLRKLLRQMSEALGCNVAPYKRGRG